MPLIDLLGQLFTDYTLRTVALGSAILGTVSGALGSYAVLRKQSLLGDAMSHAALPGIVVAFMLTASKAPLVLVLGAAVAGWVGTLVIRGIVTMTRIKYDSALALVLSVFFGLGLVLLTYVQRQPGAAKAGLDTFLFGQAAALLQRDVITMGVLTALVLVCVAIFWNQFKVLSFDPEYGRSLGLPMSLLDFVLTALLVIAIVLGLQTVGVVLMSAMIVAPAAAARQWTDKMGTMVIIAAVFGAISGICGALISSTGNSLPTGPTIVLSISSLVVISIFLAPNRGLIWKWLRQARNRRRLRIDVVLQDMYYLAQQHDNFGHAHDMAAIDAMSASDVSVQPSLEVLETRGMVARHPENRWGLTPAGLRRAREISAEIENEKQ